MKRNDKDNAEYIRSKLNPLNEKIVLPDELSAENITALVSGKEQKKNKKGKIITFRTLSSVAAAIILAFGIGAAVRHFTKPAIDKMPEEIEQAVTPLSNNTEQTIIDYFTVLKAEHDDNKFHYFVEGAVNNALDFGAKAEDEAMPESGMFIENSMATDTNTSATGSSHGTTNVQVQGIDEDDIIKNDGKYIYVLSDSSVKIIDAADMKLMSKTDFESRGSNGMYIYKNTLAVVGHDYTEANQTILEIYDITDKSKPVLVNEVSQDGGYFSSRLIGGKVILLSQFYVYPEDINLTKGYAVYDDIAPSVTVNGVCEHLDPHMITILPQQKNYSEAYTVMTTVDLDSDKFKPITSAVLGTGENVYCTAENLYVCDTVYNRNETVIGEMVSVTDLGPTTKIHRFSIKDGTIRSEATGEVDGRMLNQFSIDEKGEYIRVATTGTANSVFVLNKSLKKISEITGIAKGETIQSVRYIGDYGYVVTFRQTDPLFVIDFGDMKNPEIVGELKIPGFSSYLHPFNGYLVGIGTDGDDFGTTDALKISLFDISDPTKPQEIDRFKIAHAYAETGHKTVMDCSEKDILGFIYYDNRTGDSQLATLRIKEGKIEHIGSYTNRKEGESESGTVYTPDGGEEIIMYDKTMYSTFAIRRATYIGNTLYTISEHRICSYPIEGGKVIATLDF